MPSPEDPSLEQLVNASLRDLAAWPWRKRRMREELLSHLQQAYAQEASNGPAAALERVRRRWGQLSDLKADLAESVSPIERRLAPWLFSEESPMAKRFFIASCFFLAVLWMISIPEHALFIAGGLATLALSALARRLERSFGPGWWARGHLPLLAGIFGVLFGTAMILPALARMQRETAPLLFLIGPLVVGILVVCLGAGAVAWQIRRRLMRA